jgi:hypothetical protein
MIISVSCKDAWGSVLRHIAWGLAVAGCGGEDAPQISTSGEHSLPSASTRVSHEISLPSLPAGAIAVVNGSEIALAKFVAMYDSLLKGRRIDDPSGICALRKSVVESLIWREVLKQELTELKLAVDLQEADGLWGEERFAKIQHLHELALLAHHVSDSELEREYMREAATAPHVVAHEIFLPAFDQQLVRGGGVLFDYAATTGRRPDANTERRAHQAYEKQVKAEAWALYRRADGGGEFSLHMSGAEHRIAEIAEGDMVRSLIADPEALESTGCLNCEAHLVFDLQEKAFRAAFKSKPGEVLKPIKTSKGWHVLKIMEVAPPPPLAEYEPVLRRKLASRMQSRISLVKAQTIKKYRVVDNITPPMRLARCLPTQGLSQ